MFTIISRILWTCWFLSLLLTVVLLLAEGRSSHHKRHSRRHVLRASQSEFATSQSASQSEFAASLQNDESEFPIDMSPYSSIPMEDIDQQHLLATNETIQEYVDQQCSSCLAHEEAKVLRIEQIKRELLEKLGFAAPPNISKADLPELPETGALKGILRSLGYSSDQAYRLSDDDDDNTMAKTESIFVIATEPAFMQQQRSQNSSPGSEDVSVSEAPTQENSETFPLKAAYFVFSPKTIISTVHSAILHYFVRPPATPSQKMSHLFTVNVYNIIDISNPAKPKVTLFETKQVKLKMKQFTGSWQSIDVLKLVRQWFAKPLMYHGLIIEVQYENENLVVYPQDVSLSDQNMFLELQTTENQQQSRAKRDAMRHRFECDEGSRETRCCRYPLVVDFEQAGWDWVIAPKRYYINYCKGLCPLRYLTANLHAHLAQQMNGNVGPCCTAGDLAPIQMIIFNNEKEVIVTKVPGMVVTRCHCS